MLDVKSNFKNSYNETFCPLCEKENDTQQHVLECPSIISDQLVVTNDAVEYQHIYLNDVKKQAALTRFFMGVWKIRKKKTKK